MPKRKFNQISSTKKSTIPRKKRRVIRRRRYVISKGPFPMTKIAKMRLSIPLQTFTCTLGALARISVQANRPYSGTNYAYGWNQWATLYNNYIVLGSKCRLFHQGSESSTYTQGMMGIYLSDDTTNFNTWTTMVEARKGTWRMCNVNINDRVLSAVSKYSAKKHYNIKDIRDNVERLGATMTAGPADGAYFNCWFQPTNQSDGVTFYATILVDYIVMFSEPKDVAAS